MSNVNEDKAKKLMNIWSKMLEFQKEYELAGFENELFNDFWDSGKVLFEYYIAVIRIETMRK